MSSYDFITKEVITNMVNLQKKSDSCSLPKLETEAVKNGLDLSRRVCAQKEFIAITPWMKNLLLWCGDLKKGGEKKVTVQQAKNLKANQYLKDLVNKCLLRYNGQKQTEFNESLSILDPAHYNVDCWLANKFDDYWFDIKEGQAKEREEVFKKYEFATEISTKQMVGIISKMPSFWKTINFVFKLLPDVKADHSLVNVDLPFQNRDSNVSYPFFKNDRRPKEHKSTQTMGNYVLEFTKKLTSDGANPWKCWNYNVYTAYARNQRGKGRGLEAQSRVMNIMVNALESPEMAKYKTLPNFIGLQNSEVQKEHMIRMAEFCMKNPDYVCGNWDQTKFDIHISQGFNALNHAIRKMHANGPRSKQIADLRYCQIDKAWLLNGPKGQATVMHGRTPSGDIDTTLNNSMISLLLDIASNLSMDKDYAKNVLYKTNDFGFYLGDDVLSIHKRDPKAKKFYSDFCNKLGYEVNESKYAYGCFFLQYRLFKEEDKYIMCYPWPRVLRSMLSKEESKGLGPAGWTLAGWQQLSKLVENPTALKIVTSIICELDEQGLMLNKDISEIIKDVRKEDDEAKSKDKYAKTTSSILYDGNPQTEGTFFAANGEINSTYLRELQAKLRAAYDKDFFENLGVVRPSKVTKK